MVSKIWTVNPSKRSTFLSVFLALFPAIAFFWLGALTQFETPGVYMDAVNPDYMIVGLLNAQSHLTTWSLPGSLLFGRFPILGQIYHGALPYYLGMPAYMLFGSGVLGIRVANLSFGTLVLTSIGLFLNAFNVRPAVILFTTIALSLDAGYLFSFRTQFYITLLPIAFVFISFSLAENCKKSPPLSIVGAAGFCAGLAFYGYFIYLFFIPTLALHAASRWAREPRRNTIFIFWCGGAAIGGSPYVLGILLMIFSTGGLLGFESFLSSYLKALSVAPPTASLNERLQYILKMATWTLQDVGPTSMMLQKTYPFVANNLRIALLVVAPIIALVSSIFDRRMVAGLYICVGLFIGFVCLFLTFGTRLWLHHAIIILPITYVALALSIDRFVCTIKMVSYVSYVFILSITCPLIFTNALVRHAVFLDLEQTGGVGLYSDAINRFSEDARADVSSPDVFLPGWGLFMPFEMITEGRMVISTDFDPQTARKALCNGHDVVLGVVNSQYKSTLVSLLNKIDGFAPTIKEYSQRNKVPLITAVRWRGMTGETGPCLGAQK